MDVTSLQYPKKSHRKTITFPFNCIELSEFIGVLFGDGEVSNPWQFTISLNSIADREYSYYLTKLIFSLFALTPKVFVRKSENTLKIVTASISAVDFLITKGVVRGNKIKQQIDIPHWILNNQLYACYFIRGLFDTDGGFYTHHHFVSGKSYTHIGFCFCSLSLPLVNSIAQILRKYDINPHIEGKGTKIYLYSQKDIITYLNVIGSSNPRIYKKFENWRGVRVV